MYIQVCMYICIYVQMKLNALPLSWIRNHSFPFHEWNNWSNAIHLLLYDSSVGRWIDDTYSSYRNNYIGSIFICMYVCMYVCIYVMHVCLVGCIYAYVCIYVHICVCMYRWYWMLPHWAPKGHIHFPFTNGTIGAMRFNFFCMIRL